MTTRMTAVRRCPREGRKVAWLEIDGSGATWFHIVGGRRGDLTAAAEWADATGRAATLGVLDTLGNQLQWWVPTASDPAIIEPYHHALPKLTEVPELLRAWLDEAPPVRTVCPHCHRIVPVSLGVSSSGVWLFMP